MAQGNMARDLDRVRRRDRDVYVYCWNDHRHVDYYEG